MNIRKLFLLTVLLCIGFYSCEKDENLPSDNNYEIITPEAPQDKGDRLFGINISESIDGFISSFTKGQEAGIEVVELNLQWSDLEPTEGQYTDPWGNIAATTFYGSYNIKVGFSISVINTVKWEIPDYLNGVDITSAQFESAFNNLIDWFVSTVPENVEIVYLSIGNEVDLVLESNEDWADYTEFYQGAVSHIHSNYPSINVGVKTTVMNGVYKTELDKLKDINQYSDIIMLNYYPQNDYFEVLDPNIVKTHFSYIVSQFTDKDIWFTEVGYQSGDVLCKSSEKNKQNFTITYLLPGIQIKIGLNLF